MLSRKFSMVAITLFSMAMAMFVSSAVAAEVDFDEPKMQKKIVVKVSHVVKPETPKGLAFEFFKKRAEELTDGAVEIQIYPESQLFKDIDEMNALKMNSVQIIAPSLAGFSKMDVYNFEAFDLPLLFNSIEDVHKVTMGMVGREMFKSLESHGVLGLGYWDNDFKQFSMKTPIHKPSDFIGKKMRIQESKVLDLQMKALGAYPLPLPFSDVVKNMKSGVIDGAENPVSNFYSKKMYEHQKYLALTNHGYLGYAVLTNKTFWNSLPKNIKSKLYQAMEEATVYANKVAAEKSMADLEAVRKLGTVEIIVPTPEEKAELRQALLPVHKQVESRIGRDTIKSIYRAIGFKN